MKFIQFLNESPAMITASREKMKNHAPNFIALSKLINKSEKEGFYEYKDIYKFTNRVSKSTSYFVLDEENKKVLFYSQISSVSGSSFKGNVDKQSFIYQDASFKGAADYIFMRLILENHGTILSDSDQTKGGKSFWKKLFDKYRDTNNYEVGYYDGLDKKYVPFHKDDTDSDFNDHYKGSNQHYNHIYIKAK